MSPGRCPNLRGQRSRWGVVPSPAPARAGGARVSCRPFAVHVNALVSACTSWIRPPATRAGREQAPLVPSVPKEGDAPCLSAAQGGRNTWRGLGIAWKLRGAAQEQGQPHELPPRPGQGHAGAGLCPGRCAGPAGLQHVHTYTCLPTRLAAELAACVSQAPLWKGHGPDPTRAICPQPRDLSGC